MKPTVVWIVGEPGVGKTTLSRALFERIFIGVNAARSEVAKPKYTLFGAHGAAAGFWRGNTFDGADTLPISDIKPAIAYIHTHLMDRQLVWLDGDKLASGAAFDAVKLMGCNTVCFLLDDADVATRRRAERGTNQNEVWVRGRRTKARNFFDRVTGPKSRLDPKKPTAELIGEICRGIAISSS